MKVRYRTIAITISVLTIVIGTVSCNAANWFSFYVVGGLGKAETEPLYIDSVSSEGRPLAVASKDADTTFRIGGGYSSSKRCSVESSNIVGSSEQRSLDTELTEPDHMFSTTADFKIDQTIFRERFKMCPILANPIRKTKLKRILQLEFDSRLWMSGCGVVFFG